MNRDTRIQLIAGTVLAGCLAGSTVLSVALAGEAGRSKLVMTDRAEENAPWEVSVGIAMGAFRGVFVNFLWMRANEMKEKGKFYEAVQLSDAITRLQPRFPRVWVFHAWNLAYNLSVETQTQGERWEWVSSGINLLRSRGIPANPNEMLLYRELGWIFEHKIGGNTDDANLFYKRMLAQEWTVAVGPPPPRIPADRDRAACIARYAGWIRAYAEAPDSLEETIAREPSVGPLVQAIRASGLEGDWDLLQRYELWNAMKRGGNRVLWKKVAGAKTAAAGGLIDDPAHAKAWPALLAHVRRRVLIDRYNMDPATMVRYTEKYGPMDWRHYGAHAVYWSALGVENADVRWSDQNKADFDFINADRVTAQSVQELFRTGDLSFDFFTSTMPNRYTLWLGVPNPHFVQSYGDILEDMVSRSWADNSRMRGTMPLATGYENFIRDAICFFYSRGELDKAEEWYEKLRNFKYLTLNDPARKEELSVPIREFVEKELVDDLERPSVAVAQVSASLQQAYASLLTGEVDIFSRQFEYAKMVHRKFMETQHRITAASKTDARMDQMPDDFRVVCSYQFVAFVDALSLDDAEVVYDNAPEELRAFSYDPLEYKYRAQFDEMIRANPGVTLRGFDSVFPRPQGLEDARAFRAAWEARRMRETTELERK
jgi:hypothetical protein